MTSKKPFWCSGLHIFYFLSYLSSTERVCRIRRCRSKSSRIDTVKRHWFRCLTRLEWNLEWMLTLIVSSCFALFDICKLSVCPIVLLFQWLLLLVFILSFSNASPPFADYTFRFVTQLWLAKNWNHLVPPRCVHLCLVSKRATLPQVLLANLCDWAVPVLYNKVCFFLIETYFIKELISNHRPTWIVGRPAVAHMES